MKPGFIYTKEQIPNYTCPLCDQGKLVPDLSGLLSRQTGESVALSKLDYWESSFHKELLRIDTSCNNKDCLEVGSIILKGHLYEPEHEEEADVYYSPIYIYPAPKLFTITDNIPIKITKLLSECFNLFWSDPVSCGNKIRICVEVLLDEQGIDAYVKNKNGVATLNSRGRPTPITLHSRLDNFRKKGKEGAACVRALESIKWLGNESSHNGLPVHQEFVYKAIRIFGAVTQYLYDETPIPQETNYSINKINEWYRPKNLENKQ